MSIRQIRDLVTVVGSTVTDPVSRSKFSIDSPKGRKVLKNVVLADMAGSNPAGAYIMGDKVYNPSSGQFIKTSGVRGRAIIAAATEEPATTSTGQPKQTPPPEPIKGKVAGKPWIIDVGDLLSVVEPFRIVNEFGVAADPRTAAGRNLIRNAIRRHEKQVQDAGGKQHLYMRGVDVFNPVTGKFSHVEKRSSENTQMLVRMAWDDPSLRPRVSGGGRKPGGILTRERKPDPITLPDEFVPFGGSKIWEVGQTGLRVKPRLLELSSERILSEREKGKTSADLIEAAAEDIGEDSGAGVFTGRGTIERRGQVAEFAEADETMEDALDGHIDELVQSAHFTEDQVGRAKAGMMRVIKDINEARGINDLRMVITTEFETPQMLDEVAEAASAELEQSGIMITEAAKESAVSALIKASRIVLNRRDTAEVSQDEQRMNIQLEAVRIIDEEIAGIVERANAAAEPIDMRQLEALRLAVAQAGDTVFGINPSMGVATMNAAAQTWLGISPLLVKIASDGGEYSGAALRVLKAGNKVVSFSQTSGLPITILMAAGTVAVMRWLFMATGDIVKESGTVQQKSALIKQLARTARFAQPPVRGGTSNQPSIEAAYIAHANAEITRAKKESTYDVRNNRSTAVTRPLISDERVMFAGY